jgi:hypothetical protein
LDIKRRAASNNAARMPAQRRDRSGEKLDESFSLAEISRPKDTARAAPAPLQMGRNIGRVR